MVMGVDPGWGIFTGLAILVAAEVSLVRKK